tara:strand:+ start:55 stop:291 length:237 start_codon:yes stop_codon:yes gene_type:complete
MSWGKMDELEEEMVNLKQLMEHIKKIYASKTKIKKKELNEILKHDLWWDAKKCLECGLVDKINRNNLVYDFDENNLDV